MPAVFAQTIPAQESSASTLSMQQDDPFLKPLISSGKKNPAVPVPSGNYLPRQANHSYSFDSREWVDAYTVENSDNTKDTNPFSSNESQPLFGNRPPLPESINENKNDNADEPIDSDRNKTIKVASAVSPSEKLSGNELFSPPKNQSASYTKQLPNVMVCGWVVVQANFPLTEIQSILNEIELLQRDLTLYMGVPQPKEKIELCLFKDEKSFNQFLSERFPKAPRDRRALYIKLNNMPGTLLVQRSEEFEVDLRHEMTHALIHASIPYVPIWLDEGLAKYFEVPVENRSLNNPYMKVIRWNVRFGAVPSLRRLERLEDISEMGGREYRDSWAWVHFMIHHSPKTHRLLAGYLQLLYSLQTKEGAKPVQNNKELPALEGYIKDAVEDPREEYREHFRTWGLDTNKEE
ncbi:hypothetical protein FACS18942_07800 [Planctomycetales bacterium]|nr:hypothetical protein FACS18942_07800 [Planctomycetales bacterium]GHT37855.1 hypothetical protein FACS189427_11370 [Planctomycetales bacterium]